MKILLSCLSKSWGGLEMYTITSALQLVNNGLDIKLIAYPGSKIFNEADKLNLPVYPIKAGSYFHPLQIIKLISYLKKEKFDLIHSQLSRDLWILVPALNFGKIKIPLFLTKQMGSFVIKKDFLHTYLYKRISKIFAISEVIRKNISDTCPIKPQKISLLHNGVDTEYLNPKKFDRNKIRDEFKISESDILIGMIGRISPGKGHEEFLQAAKIISAKENNAKFFIVGDASAGEDDYSKKIFKMGEELNKKNRLIFSGFRKDIPEVLSAFDVFIFPSHSEAFGIALAEAMSMGKASIATGSDGVLDLIEDNQSGLLFEKLNYKQLAEKIIKLIGSEKERNRIGNNARERAVKKFDIKVLTNRVINFYEESLK